MLRRWTGLLVLLCVSLSFSEEPEPHYLSGSQLEAGLHHCHHLELYGPQASGYNPFVLQAIDAVQRSAPDGGGYFTGVHAEPAESPIGYPLSLFGQALLTPPRSTSYCSGSSYAVFIEALNRIFPGAGLDPQRREALRMQEPDGSRREDRVKAWGWWNADGYGNHYCMVQYLGVGEVVSPRMARPGDFLNIGWNSGLGHSVVFLGYSRDPAGELELNFFSSQASTGGLADRRVSARLIHDVKFVRLTHPERIWEFAVDAEVESKVAGDNLDF